MSLFLQHAAAAAKSLQSCPTLFDPIDSSPLGSSVPGILQARTLEWVVISVSNAWKWKVKVKSLSRARLLATPWTVAYQAPLSMGFSRQEYWSGVPCSRLMAGKEPLLWGITGVIGQWWNSRGDRWGKLKWWFQRYPHPKPWNLRMLLDKAKITFAYVIKDLEMNWLPWIICVSWRCNHIYLYKRKAERDLTQRKRCEWCWPQPRNAGATRSCRRPGGDCSPEPLEGARKFLLTPFQP